MVDVLDTGEWNPQQALLKAMSYEDEIDFCAIAYIRKGADTPSLLYSTMSPIDMHFLGLAMQIHALKHMKE